MTSYWCEYAWLGSPFATAGVLLEVDDGVFTSVRPAVPCPAHAVRLNGLTLPGMANAHSHAFHRALRGRTQIGSGSFWTWREQMYGLVARLTPDTYFELARAVYGEMALAGITTVGEFHYLHHGPGGVPYDDPNAMSAALVAAATEVGIRITLLDACYLHGGIDVPLNATQERFSDGDALVWAERVSSFVSSTAATSNATSSNAGTSNAGTVRVGAAIHSVRAVDPAGMAVVEEWATAHAAPLHAHVSEQPAENHQCIEAYGMTPTVLLHEQGALTDRFTAVHATHLSGVDIGLYGSHRCTICLCPTTERDLADGIGPAQALRESGASLSLGSDSHAVIDLFEEARAVELNERLATNTRGHHDAVTLLTAATSAGHRALGHPDVGTIAPGAPADLVSVRLDTVRTAGATAATALETAVFAASAADVHHVMVAGRVVVRDAMHVHLDVAAELSRTIAATVGDA